MIYLFFMLIEIHDYYISFIYLNDRKEYIKNHLMKMTGLETLNQQTKH